VITALLVDDEPLALDRLAALLEEFETVDVVGTARSVDDAERFLRGRVPDVVFLDINMPGRLGIDLVASVPAGTRVVFVTAMEGHAVDAFRHGAVD
jgi:DNA-binding LytR/AlgR family response regulator